MDTDEKVSPKIFLVKYYDDNKRLIDIIAFVGLISGIFLQITQFQGEDLRLVQACLLITFGSLLFYLLIKFWIQLIKSTPETNKSIVINGMLLSYLIGIFIFNLSKFIYVSFRVELITIFILTRLGIVILVGLYFSDITRYLNNKLHWGEAWTIIDEFFWGALLYFFVVGIKFELPLIALSVGFVLSNIALRLKWIPQKRLPYLVVSACLIFLLIQYHTFVESYISQTLLIFWAFFKNVLN